MKSTIRDLRLINAAIAQTNLTGYKALVCLFMGGGNDANNWIVPTDGTSYAEYAGLRGILALPQSSLLTLNKPVSAGGGVYRDADGHTFGLHPACTKMQTLFAEGKLAGTLNVGTLVRPTSLAQYQSGLPYYRPPQLFSHSDQVTQWQTSIPDQPPATGWGGRVADLLDSTANPAGNISMSVSVNGANTFEIGNLVSRYDVSTTGAVTLSGDLMTGTGARLQAMKDLLALSNVNLQRTAYAQVNRSAIDTGVLLNTNIQPTAMTTDTPPGTWVWNAPFPPSSLGNQLKMIARLIQARGPFNMNRQVFFCTTGGFDTHTNQVTFNANGTVTPTTGTHANLLSDISECMYAFQRAMEQLGVGDKVTTFTASDFARTFPTNSQGSDHGWGSHHFVMGGAVNGGQTIGHLPAFVLNGPNDTGLGRWLPTTSVDQHAATIARWFGVDEGNIGTIFPNVSRFATSNLGFML